MYCILKYVEFLDFQRQFADDDKQLPAIDSKHLPSDAENIKTNAGMSLTISVSTATSIRTQGANEMWGSEQQNDAGKTRQLYFNPNCFVQLILDYICDEIGIKTESDFDLCNDEGDLLNIKDYERLVNGTVMFTPRETYFVVLQARNTKGKISDVQVLLPRTSEMYFSINTYILTKIPKRSSFGEKQGVTFKKRRVSRSSKESNNFVFVNDFGVLKKPKSKSSKSHQHLVHN